jgi:hypothetical protein
MKDVIDSILRAVADFITNQTTFSSYQSNPHKSSHSGTYNSNYQSDGNFILEANSSRGCPVEHLEPGNSTLVFKVVARVFDYKKHISLKNTQDVSGFNTSSRMQRYCSEFGLVSSYPLGPHDELRALRSFYESIIEYF